MRRTNPVRRIAATAFVGAAMLGVSGAAKAVPTIDLFETGDDEATLVDAVLAPASGITVVGGTTTFVGRAGDGNDPNTAQSGTYSGFLEVPNNAGLPTISNPDGLLLTSGVANIPGTNTTASFDHLSVGVPAPGTGGDADLSAILTAAGAPSSVVNDVNFLEFTFTVDNPSHNAVSAQFVFASDEFPDQLVTDVFGFFIDGVNFAFFPDDSLVSFVTGVNADNFNDNNVGTGNYDIEYDGISNSLNIVGLLDPTQTDHTIKIAIGDTSDTIFDSAVFIGDLQSLAADIGGVNQPTTSVSEPGAFALLGAGLIGLLFARRRQDKA